MNQSHPEDARPQSGGEPGEPVSPPNDAILMPNEISEPDDTGAVTENSRDAGHGGDPRNGAGGAEGVEAAEEPDQPIGAAEPRRQQARITVDPTPEQRESHICTGHAVFEPWCLDCCRGRAQEWAHYVADRTMDEIPTILWDYGYLSSPSEGRCTPEEELEEERKGSSPFLVAWDSQLKRFWAHVIPAKGTDFPGFESVLNLIVEELKHTGYRKVVFRSDGEPSLVAFLRAVATRWDIQVVPQVSAPGDIKSHGAVENAIKLAKGHVRTLRSALQRRLDTEIPPEHPIITWICRHASQMHYRFAIGRDRRTAHQRLTGRAYNQRVAELCGKIE